MNRCLACGHNISSELFDPGPQPLAALNLPRTHEAAVDSLRLPMKFNSCSICGHVWNTDFDYAQVPYAGDSNLMYNSGVLWQAHMQRLIDKLVENSKVWAPGPLIDIGCGDGSFFTQLLGTIPDADCIGFEPGIEGDKITTFKCVRDYFIPERDLKRYRPKFLSCRHVIEHLQNPRDFVAEIAYWCSRYDLDPIFLAEVPCFDTAIKTGRISDFLYEHVSNFTLNSLFTLFVTSGFNVLEASRYYGDEVIVGFFTPHNVALKQHEAGTEAFAAKVSRTFESIGDFIADLHQSAAMSSVALWGGTGKSSAFINMFKFDGGTFPLVVDSDVNKLGRHVPGTGQEIQSPQVLVGGNPIIIITTAWRAEDIYNDIKSRGIQYNRLLVLHDGILSDYNPTT